MIDNQKTVSTADQAIANPAPTTRDFSGNNAKHKVVLAVIDTGVDYNHPLLKNNIHFSLNTSGQPVGTGRDFIGADEWASPYVVRTSLYDPAVGAEERAESVKAAGQMDQIIAAEPSLATYLDRRRNATQEYTAGAYHGTHVAGLMVYDREDLGLRAYRVLPSNKYADQGFDYTTESVDMIAGAMEQAAKDGARVVNMSLGLSIDKALAEDGEAAEKAYQKLKTLKGKVEEVARKYPNVLFVSAAGNDGGWRDAENKTGLPCGIEADNALCVGALRENGDPATFTNVTLDGVDLVFALGHNVLSTLPSEMCVDEAMQDLMMLSFGGSVPDAAKALKTGCAKSPGMGKLSGTSMASPIVARVAGMILADNPTLTGAQVIEKIYDEAVPSFIGNMPVFKVRVRKPSWYSATPPQTLAGMFSLENLGLAESDLEDQYWEGVLK